MSITPPRGVYFIRGGAVITVDPALGTLPQADVLVRDGVIEKIGVGLSIPAHTEVIDARGMIVMPGLIDTHCHMWETLGRSFLSDDAGYFKVLYGTMAAYAPEDFYNSVSLALVEHAAAGVTTVHNWSHNPLSPATVDAELQAHRDSLLRARYSYGPTLRDTVDDPPIDYREVDRVRQKWFGTSSPFEGLVHLGVNIGGGTSQIDGHYVDLEEARKRELPCAVHEAFDPPSNGIAPDLERHGYLGPKCLFAHLYGGTPEDFAALARCKVPLTFATCTAIGSKSDPHTALAYMRKYGLTISLSSDASAVGPFDMLQIIRLTRSLGVTMSGPAAAGLRPIKYLEAIEMGTINGAKALGLDQITGSLTPGKRADLILIDTNQLGVAPASVIETAVVKSASGADVDTVMVDGRIVKRGGRLIAYDSRKVTTLAQASAMRVRKRVGDWLTP